MARSIHATRAELERERAWRWADPGLRKQRLRRIARALGAKRRIKKEVRRERALVAADAPASPLDPDTLPVRVVDHGPLIHYPATEADVRAILRALPPGAGDGLTEIELVLGKEKQRATAHELELTDDARDPTGRLAREGLPGVFRGLCLGVYSRSRARIRLYAFVYDPALQERETFEPYLKLRMLATLVHEVAHHVDVRTRVARGRWRADDEEKLETYAETRQHEWVQEIVVPYVARAYPQAVAALDRWIVEQTGAPVPLALLAGDPRASFDLAAAFEEFVRDVRDKPLDATRVEFAANLLHEDQHALAHRVLDAVLAAEPLHTGALTLRAEVFHHERRLAEAEATVRGVLARDERCLEALQILIDLHRDRRAWPEVVAAAARGLELAEAGDPRRLSFAAARARALLELGEYAAFERDITVLLAEGGSFERKLALGLRAIALLRAGRLAEALAAANDGLRQTTSLFWRHELLAVRFEATRALHPSTPPEPLLPETIAALHHRGHEAWAERLRRAT